jgi:putative tryptophan/tyrosine transport system substrate-binding protein
MRRREFITLLGSAAATVWPLAARAQQRVPVIGYLSTGSAESDADRVTGLKAGLNEAGYAEGRNVVIQYRWAEDQYDRLPRLADDLVNREVAVIVAVGTPPALAAKAATSTIPIVFNASIDPVQFGLVAALNRPGGNVTGISVLNVAVMAKRVELLHELVPNAGLVGMLANPTNPFTEPETREMRGAIQLLGLQFQIANASKETDIEAAFASLVQKHAGALVVSADPLFTNNHERIVALAAGNGMPAIYPYRRYPAAGGLISYGTNFVEAWRQTGVYVGQILKGAKPADLPVQQVTKLDLVINMKTAKTLGLTVPLSLLGRADEIIE